MSERGGREQVTRRSSFRRASTETPLPPEYQAELDEKRRQLDESIHKYIAAKERDYKTFEKELRQQHRAAQGQDGLGRRRSGSDIAQHDGADVLGSANGAPIPAASTTDDNRSVESIEERKSHRSAIAGLTDRRASLERDRDFAGLFTPPYLSAIDDRNARESRPTPSQASSVPTSSPLGSPGSSGEHLRANSDSTGQAKPKRPSHLAFFQRTSSSGSSADGKLPSALKSPSQLPRQSGQKRVSLALGDAIVAPSDNLPAAASSSNTPSHSRQRSSGARKGPTNLSRETSQSSIVLDDGAAAIPSAASATTSATSESDAGRIISSSAGIAPPTASPLSGKISSTPRSPVAAKLDPDGDLFDLEELENDPIEHDDFESALESEDDEDEIAETDGVIDDIELGGQRLTYDSREGVVPEPEDGQGSAVPYLEFKPGSSVVSQQPINAGFRRPSVADDPVFRGNDYRSAEREAVEDDVYGSSFVRPSSKGSFTAGSLGESYMAAHAAKMEGSRAARKQMEVKT